MHVGDVVNNTPTGGIDRNVHKAVNPQQIL